MEGVRGVKICTLHNKISVPMCFKYDSAKLMAHIDI